MYPIKRFVFILILVFAAQICLQADEVAFQIRFYEKRIYYLNDREHPVSLEATLTNNSSRTFRFKMAENRMYNFFPESAGDEGRENGQEIRLFFQRSTHGLGEALRHEARISVDKEEELALGLLNALKEGVILSHPSRGKLSSLDTAQP